MTAGAQRALLLLPALLVLGLYWPSTGFGLVWDDPFLLDALPGSADWGALWQAIWQPFLGPGNYLRPLPLLTLGLEKIAGGSFLAHLDNLLLHALNASLVALIAWRLALRRGSDDKAALAAGLIAGLAYALHPALTEAAAWLSVRPDLLMTSFCLGALLADLRLASAAARAVAMALLFFFAALSKEAALGFALALPAWQLARVGQPLSAGKTLLSRDHLTILAAVFAAGLAYLAVRALALGYVLAPAPEVVERADIAALPLLTLAKYAEFSLLPFGKLSPVHYLDAQAPFLQLLPFAGAVLLALFALLLVRNRNGLAALALCWLLSLLPVLNFLPVETGDNYVHERFLVLPLAFLCIAGGLTAPLLWRAASAALRRMLAGFALIWAGLCMASIVLTLPHWRDELSLWRWAHQRAPASWAAQTNLHSALVKNGDAMAAYQLAADIRARYPQPVNPSLENSDAMMLQGHGQPALAVDTLQRALQKPAPPATRDYLTQQLGYLHLVQGRPAAARAALAPLAARAQAQPETLYFLGIAELMLGEAAAGEAHLQTGLAAMPEAARAAQLRKAREFVAKAARSAATE